MATNPLSGDPGGAEGVVHLHLDLVTVAELMAREPVSIYVPLQVSRLQEADDGCSGRVLPFRRCAPLPDGR